MATRRPTKPAQQRQRPSRPGGPRGRSQGPLGNGQVSTSAVNYQRPQIVVKPEDLADFNESFNWCVYGNSGVGKTVFTAHAPGAYILSTEKGVVSAKRVGAQAKLLRAPTWDHVEASIEWCDANLTEKDIVVVDSTTKMQELLAYWWLGIQHADNPGRDIDILQIQDYQKWQRMFLRFVNHLVDAPYNTIFVATAMRREDEEGEDLVMPNIVGKDYAICQNFCADLDIVSCLRVKKRANIDDPREAMLINDTWPPYFAKDRFNVLPRWETIPDGSIEGEYDTIAGMIEDILALSPEERKAAKAAVS